MTEEGVELPRPHPRGGPSLGTAGSPFQETDPHPPSFLNDQLKETDFFFLKLLLYMCGLKVSEIQEFPLWLSRLRT